MLPLATASSSDAIHDVSNAGRPFGTAHDVNAAGGGVTVVPNNPQNAEPV
jgi:hypothetical protein